MEDLRIRIKLDSKIIREFNEDEDEDYFDNEIVMNDFKYIEYLYTDPNLLNLYESLHLFNTLVKYDFIQLEDYIYLFYFRFGIEPFNENSFLFYPKDILKEISRNNVFLYVCNKNLIFAVKWLYPLTNIIHKFNFMNNILEKVNLDILIFLDSVNFFDKHKLKYDCFNLSCHYNRLENVKFFYSISNIDIESYIINNFKILIMKKNNEVIKWLYTLCEDKKIFTNATFLEYSITSVNFELAKFFYSFINKYVKVRYIYFFNHICKYGDLEFIKWLYLINKHSDLVKYKYKFFIYCNNSCKFKTVKWLLETFDYNDNDIIEDILSFDIISIYNTIDIDTDVIKYLLNRFGNYERFFLKLVFFDNVECVQYILHNYLLSDSIIIESFKLSIYYDRFEVNKILYLTGKISEDDIYKSFSYACINDKIETIKYLLIEYNIDIHYQDNYFYSISIYKGKTNTLKYLYSLSPIDNSYIIKYFSNSLKISKFLYSLCNISDEFMIELFFKAVLNYDIDYIKWIISLNIINKENIQKASEITLDKNKLEYLNLLLN
jgi:hypothetical protein